MQATELQTERLTERAHEVLCNELLHGWDLTRTDMVHFVWTHDDGSSFAVDYDGGSDVWILSTETGKTLTLHTANDVVDLSGYIQTHYVGTDRHT